MSLTKLSLGRNNLYMTSQFPPKESLVSDIPAGDGNVEKLFYGVGLGSQCIRFRNMDSFWKFKIRKKIENCSEEWY
jgi:hypothetical protein